MIIEIERSNIYPVLWTLWASRDKPIACGTGCKEPKNQFTAVK